MMAYLLRISGWSPLRRVGPRAVSWRFSPLLGLLICCSLVAVLMCAGARAEEVPAFRLPDSLPVNAERIPRRIAFGSCSKQTKPQPILDVIVGRQPDLFIYLGDNIYGDTRDMAVLRVKYQQLADKPEFQRLRTSVPVLATWDDHDYGENDAGKEYPFKEQSKEIFLEFWQVPQESPRRQRPGIYGVQRFREGNRTVQVILLDTRTFRDPLTRTPRNRPTDSPYKNDYQPDNSPDKTLLGTAQWNWLKGVLKEPADLRIIASSIQFGHEYNGWESWTNLPREQEKFLQLLRETQANGVLFISGDVHWGEISRRELTPEYPLYDVTASGLTETWPTLEPNRYRVGEAVRENHFGEIEVDWSHPDPPVSLRIVDLQGQIRLTETFPLSQLHFPTE